MNLVIISPEEGQHLNMEESPYTKHHIKVSAEYLIGRIIRIAYNNGVKKIFCVLNEQEELLKKYLDKTNFGMTVNVTIKNTQSSMYSLFALAPYLANESFILTTTNSIFDETEFKDFISYASIQKDVDGILAIKKCVDEAEPLCVALDDEDTILKFSDSKEGYSWAASDLYYFSPNIFDEMHFVLATGIIKFKDFLRLLIAQGHLMKGFSFSNIFDINHISGLKESESFVKRI